MDKKTQALVAQYARSLEEDAFEQNALSTIKKEVKQIETIRSNVDAFLAPPVDHDRDHLRSTQRE